MSPAASEVLAQARPSWGGWAFAQVCTWNECLWEPHDMRSILASLVVARGMQPEPVATDGLTHVLRTSSAARGALEALVRAAIPEFVLDELTYGGQATMKETLGRPDIVGADEHGPRLLIEAKFDAELTPAQAGTEYLDWLPVDQVGVLLYLVPKNRVPAMWPTLLKGPGQVPTDQVLPADPSHADGPWFVHVVDPARGIMLVSWESLLNAIEGAVTNQEERSDVSQLVGLVREYLKSGWVPVAVGDLTSRTGAQLKQLRLSLFKAVSSANVPETMLPGMSDVGTGRYLTVNKKRAVWAGIHTDAWARYGEGPLWAQVDSPSLQVAHQVREALGPLTGPGEPGLYEGFTNTTVLIPLRVGVGGEPGEVTNALASQLGRIRSLVAPVMEQPDVPEAAPNVAVDNIMLGDGDTSQDLP